MACTRSGMASAPYKEYRAPLSAVVALVAMYVCDSSATGRFPRALLYEEVFHAWCVRELVFALLYARRTAGKVPSSIIL